MKKWYLICTKPGQENLALQSLQGHGFQCFCPTLPTPLNTTEPLFPRYLFALLEEPLMGQNWSTVRTAPGVARIVNTSPESHNISDELVLFIRARCLPMANGLRFDTPSSATLAPSGLRQRLETLFSETNSYRRVMGLIELISHRPTATAPRLQLAS
jgi:transcriptional antiterminator RfaH